MNEKQTNFFGWFSKEKKFNVDEVKQLLERIKEFNCGAIDDYLTEHVDVMFHDWLVEHDVSEGDK